VEIEFNHWLSRKRETCHEPEVNEVRKRLKSAWLIKRIKRGVSRGFSRRAIAELQCGGETPESFVRKLPCGGFLRSRKWRIGGRRM